MSAIANTSVQTKESFVRKYPLLSFFALAVVITWLLSLPSILLGLPFKPFQTAGAYGPLPGFFIRLVWTWIINRAQGSGVAGIVFAVSCIDIDLHTRTTLPSGIVAENP